MKLRHALLGASAVVLFAAPAFADPPVLDPDPAHDSGTVAAFEKTVTEDIDIDVDNKADVELKKDFSTEKELYVLGGIWVDGDIELDEWAVALVDNKQIVSGNTVLFNATAKTDARIKDDAFKNAKGNIQVNVAAGHLNTQDNAAAIATTDKHVDNAATEAEVFSVQAHAGNFLNGLSLFDEAEIGDDAFKEAEGNIQANVAAGTGNAQKNAMALAVGGNDVELAEATAFAVQNVQANTLLVSIGVDQNASVSGNAFSNARGNIQANVAAGIGNVQMNSLAVTAAAH